ncbi:MAG: hypothetical protein HY727_14260 [Candidatus Rokubacteria bacterium]|nr:hypothetical protein [Candidatus Rokubacteria bacterium]
MGIAWALLAAAMLGAAAPTSAGDARAAVEAWIARLGGAAISDLVIEQTFTLYHPDGLHPQSTGEQRILMKLPRRQRVEQTLEGRREVRLTVGDRVWVRQHDGRIYEAPPLERDRTYLLVPFRRSATDLLSEWRALGVRDGVSHVVRVGGRPVTVIGAGPGDRESPAVWLDEEYGVVRVVTRERLPKGPALVDLSFSEHRRLLDGFFFPYRQEAFVDGKMVVLVIVRSLRANTSIADELFDPEALRQGR